MHALHRRYTFAFMLLAAVGLWGCDDSSDLTNRTIDPADVEATALAAVDAVPQIDAAEQLILNLFGEIGAPVAAAASGDLDPIGLPSYTEAFDLGDGVSGTIGISLDGAFTFEFSGTVGVEGGTVTVQGSLIVTPTAEQPASGERFSINYNVTVFGPQGAADWSASGAVTLNAEGQVADYDLTIVHSVTPTGGATGVVTAMITPASYELLVTSPLGNTMRFDMDRNSMTGSITVNGQTVASISISGACADVNFVNEQYTDVTVCPQT